MSDTRTTEPIGQLVGSSPPAHRNAATNTTSADGAPEGLDLISALDAAGETDAKRAAQKR